jgi:hypothetical protein
MILRNRAVYALDGIGRVNDPAYRRWKGKEGDDLVPGATPGGGDRRKLLPPGTVLEALQFGCRGLGAGRRVDRFDGRRQRLTFLPARIVQAVADQMHDTGLQRRVPRLFEAQRGSRRWTKPFRPTAVLSVLSLKG